jgi:transcriptional regulator with XRE-family HTH domain
VTESTVTNWEVNRTTPTLRFLPAIIRFLGYLPFPCGVSIAEQLIVTRRVRGLSREAAARLLGVDPGMRWESGKRIPQRVLLARIEAFLRADCKECPCSGTAFRDDSESKEPLPGVAEQRPGRPLLAQAPTHAQQEIGGRTHPGINGPNPELAP